MCSTFISKISALFICLFMILSTILSYFGIEINPEKPVVPEMELRDKITQMLMVDFRYWDEDISDGITRTGFTVMNDQVQKIVEDYNFGSVIYFAQNLVDTKQAFELTMSLQSAATKDGGIPLLICADQEGGSVYRLASGTALPGNMALGATADTKYAKMAGEIIGSELGALGINTALAPVVDVNNNANNPVIGLRSFGDNPEAVGEMAWAVTDGMEEHGVIACAKHFPGHGDTGTDSHYGLPVVNKTRQVLDECELVPFRSAINQGIDMIMTAHILYPELEKDTIVSEKTGKPEALPATMSDDIITKLLKEEMGFDGIVVTDAMNMAGITDYWDPVQAVVNSIQAGVDMICMPCSLHSSADLEKLDEIIEGVIAAVENGTIPMERIDDAVERIYMVKYYSGVLDFDAGDYSLENALSIVGCEENRETEREISAAAVTVIKNVDNTLPLRLNENSKVLMLVPYNNELSQMIMGWNRAKKAGLIPDGAQIKVVRFSSSTTQETFKDDILWADTLIFNSEVSRADRMNGGRWESKYIIDSTAFAKENAKTVIVQSLDKPYDVQSYEQADAIVAAYGCKGSSVDPTEALTGGLTGSEEAYGPNIIAAVEVVFGVFPAQGKLPVNIPKIEGKQYTDEIVYPAGYGLTYPAVK